MAKRQWLSISDLARVEGVDKAHISRRVKSLKADGRVETRSGGRRVLVDVGQYGAGVGREIDPTRCDAPDALKTIGSRRKAGDSKRTRSKLQAAREYQKIMRMASVGDQAALSALTTIQNRTR